MLQYDRDYASSQVALEHEQPLEFDNNSSHSGEDDYMHHAIIGKPGRTTMHDYQRDLPYRTLTPQEHHDQAHGHPYPAVDMINPPLSGVHYQQTVYQSPVHVMRHLDHQWNSNPENEYASALVGSLKIDDDGVGKS